MMTPTDDSRDDDRETTDRTVSLDRAAGAGGLGPGHPARIGQYAIRRVIASGGMGTVYEALQDNPRRPAAVKVVSRSMASAEGLRRLEREAQALARLRHPGIAQIYEAGTFVDGGVSLPFFALEYIPNARTITDFARIRNLDARQKLELFVQVCEAVHYGHQRGIIHRDLKPANILVDSEGRVRVIDFGVARAVDADQEQADNQTQVGQIIGTAQYMSPEQFEADSNDLDTRSDIYALGVVMFELLSGRLPYAFGSSGIFEIARVVREEAPAALDAVASGVDGEVALIAGKALAKDREQRYQSAFGLAQDIRRHLRGEAISARTTSFSYQARVFARRNKAVVGLAAAAAALLVGGVIWTSKLYVDVSAERTRAESEAARAIATNEFLKSTLESVVPPGFGDVRTIGDLCDQVARDIGDAFPESPVTEADIRNTVGLIYSQLDRRPEAEFQLRKAYDLRRGHLGATDEATIQALLDLGEYYHVFGPGDRYLETVREYHRTMVAIHGAGSDEVIEARAWLVDGLDFVGNYEAAVQEAREICRLTKDRWGPDSPEALEARNDLAYQQLMAGQIAGAAETASHVLEVCRAPGTAAGIDARAVRNTYASALVAAGRLEEAKILYGHQQAPEPLGVEYAFQGGEDGPAGDIRVLVFFETWCPFSQRYMPRVERLNRQYADLGIAVTGLTSVSRSSSDSQVRQFIADNDLTFDIFKENGRASNYFEIVGVPQTVILHEGEVVWNSSGVGWLNSRILEGLVNAR